MQPGNAEAVVPDIEHPNLLEGENRRIMDESFAKGATIWSRMLGVDFSAGYSELMEPMNSRTASTKESGFSQGTR